MKHEVGRPILPRRNGYQKRFPNLTTRQFRRLLTLDMLDQLDACQCDEARRILLGVSEQEAA